MLRSNALVGVTIGNFDGMHRGHQALFSKLFEEVDGRAARKGARPVKVLLTFAPHPRSALLRWKGQAVKDAEEMSMRIVLSKRK